MDYLTAIYNLQNGERIRRTAWGNNEYYICLASNVLYKTMDNVYIKCFPKAKDTDMLFVGQHGSQMCWLPSNSDLTANDWEIL